MGVSRRRFLRLAGLTLAAAAAPGALKPAGNAACAGLSAGSQGERVYGMLVDVTQCIGCQSCQAACQEKNGLPEDWEAQDLSSDVLTYVSEVEVTTGDGAKDTRYVRHQCFHCLSPACASACPVGALQKQSDGPVTYDASRCIGCRYCMMACPFGIPRYEWDEAIPAVAKCQLCFDRLAEGEIPACAEACPVGATQFGPREALIAEAKRRIEENPDLYVPHIYGLTEAGGTSVLFLSDVPFEQLGMREGIADQAYPQLTWEVLGKIPGVALAVGAFLSGAAIVRRRSAPNGGSHNGSGSHDAGSRNGSDHGEGDERI